jgi:putative restriction endonuclease
MPLDADIRTLLVKLAADNGFDVVVGDDGTWLHVESTQAPLKLWLQAQGQENKMWLAALSMQNVADALEPNVAGISFAAPLPEGAAAVRGTGTRQGLHALVRRAFQLSRTLPDTPLKEFLAAVKDLQPPSTTEVLAEVRKRRGQSIFRKRLIEFWQGRCAVTGCSVESLLVASHIKPWATATDTERLDVHNGLLLAPHIDAVFDAHYLSFTDDGEALLSPLLTAANRQALQLNGLSKIAGLKPAHHAYLALHREAFSANQKA